MPGCVNDPTKFPFHGRIAPLARLCAALAVGSCCVQFALAKPGGEPLVLDTQTGIHSGVSGTVLQSGPLGAPGMVPMATLPGLPQQAEPPIVVAPYVEYSAGQNNVPSTLPSGGPRPRGPKTTHP